MTPKEKSFEVIGKENCYCEEHHEGFAIELNL
jgi:hypothetical protein